MHDWDPAWPGEADYDDWDDAPMDDVPFDDGPFEDAAWSDAPDGGDDPMWAGSGWVQPPARGLDAVAIGGIIAVLCVVWGLLRGALPGAGVPVVSAESIPLPTPTATLAPTPTPAADPAAFGSPYLVDYAVTQGPHGQSYGHYAVDIAAGDGAVIVSPITGVVTFNDKDGVGNTVLAIENDFWQVVMLHGVYTVPVGAAVQRGDPVGTESNIGYTTDMQGRLCAGRDCGYHTHLNVFDRRAGRNVNPLDLLP